MIRQHSTYKTILSALGAGAAFFATLAMTGASAMAWEVIAHRGYSAAAPENTIPAFEKSIAIGADAAEMDVWQCATGELMVMHDATVDRTTDGTGTVTALTYDYLKGLDAGSWFSSTYAGTRLPTLAESLAVLKDSGTKAVVEIKQHGIHNNVVAAIQNAGMVDQSIVISSGATIIQAVHGVNANILGGWVCSGLTGTTASEQADFIAERLATYNIDFVDLKVDLVTSALVDALHDRDIPVWVWTPNSVGTMQELSAWGIDGITTNYPNLAMAIQTPEPCSAAMLAVPLFGILWMARPRKPKRATPERRYAIVVYAVAICAFVAAVSAGSHACFAAERCQIIAHRGFSEIAPENTLAAVRKAIDAGADYCECDVWPTADGAVVLMHDDSVDRTTNGRGKVGSLSLAAIRRLDAGAKKAAIYAGERVPTLDEYLAVLKPSTCNAVIEIKMRGISQKVVDSVRNAGMLERAVVIATRRDVIQEIRRMEPRLHCGLLCVRSQMREKMSPMEHAAWIVQQSHACGATFIDIDSRILSVELLAEIRRHGLPVWVWTVNERPEMEKLLQWGVDGITTNRPDMLHGMTNCGELEPCCSVY